MNVCALYPLLLHFYTNSSKIMCFCELSLPIFFSQNLWYNPVFYALKFDTMNKLHILQILYNIIIYNIPHRSHFESKHTFMIHWSNLKPYIFLERKTDSLVKYTITFVRNIRYVLIKFSTQTKPDILTNNRLIN